MSPVPEWLQQVVAAGRSGELLRGWRTPNSEGARASAVLMLFAPSPDGVRVVLTERASTMRKHAGQVSFPGGGVDSGESMTQAALREAREEIGLAADGVQILGELAPISLAVTNFVVHPVVAWWPRPKVLEATSPDEVARVAAIRVEDLADPAHRFTATRPGYAGPAFEVDHLYIWGFTAYVLDAVLTTAGLARPWDEADRRQLPEKLMR